MKFNNVLIRCSSLGQIMTAPQGKTPKQQYEDALASLTEQVAKYDAMEQRLKEMKTGQNMMAKILSLEKKVAELRLRKDDEPLSQTAKAYLTKVYAEVKYGKRSMQQLKGNKYTEKGKLVEEDGIDLICQLERKMLRKNDRRLNNDYFTGECDLYEGEDILQASYIYDVKCPWDVETFFCNLNSPLNSDYWWQLQGYFDLTGAPEGEVSYCLVSAPASLIMEERRKLLYKLDCVTEEDPRFVEASRELINNMTFEDMPAEHRRLKFHVLRDQQAIDKAHAKVEQCREYLSEIEKLHLAPYEIPQLLNAEAL
jgi:hypothetical protein